MVQGITPPETVQKAAAVEAAVAETMVAAVLTGVLDVVVLMDVAVLVDVKVLMDVVDVLDVKVLLVALETRMQSLNQHLATLVQELLETLVLMEILVLVGLVAQVQ